MALTLDDINELLDTSVEDLKEKLTEISESMQQDFKENLNAEANGIFDQLSAALGGESYANAAGNGLQNALSSLVRGRDVSLRNVANSAARAFRPDVNDFFSQSTSQIADDISSFLSFGSRNN